MNRKQAEHILDAYVRILARGCDEDAAGALREVILDAMTSCYSATTPSIAWPGTSPFTTVATPNVINNKPIVTCDAGGAR